MKGAQLKVKTNRRHKFLNIEKWNGHFRSQHFHTVTVRKPFFINRLKAPKKKGVVKKL